MERFPVALDPAMTRPSTRAQSSGGSRSKKLVRQPLSVFVLDPSHDREVLSQAVVEPEVMPVEQTDESLAEVERRPSALEAQGWVTQVQGKKSGSMPRTAARAALQTA